MTRLILVCPLLFCYLKKHLVSGFHPVIGVLDKPANDHWTAFEICCAKECSKKMNCTKCILFKSYICVLMVLFTIILVGCVRESDVSRWPAMELDWPLDNSGTKTVHIIIPAGYNVGSVADKMEQIVYSKGLKQDSGNVRKQILLETLWPGMETRTRRNDEQFSARGGGQRLSILLTSGAVDPLVHSQNQLHTSLNADIFVFLSRVCIPPHELPGKAICHELKELAHKPERFGLKHVGIDFSQFPDLPKDNYRQYDDIYFTPEWGEGMHEYIKCTADEVGPMVNGHQYFPHCEQHFIFGPMNVEVKVSYRRIYLEDWREIQLKVESLLNSFIVK